LTTLRDRHVEVRGPRVRFRFRAKSGVMQAIDLDDALLARSVQGCQDLPGQTLFQYLDESGQRRSISSTDVNDYLREVAGAEFTAKDFRTWAGTVLAAGALRGEVGGTSKAARTQFVSSAIGSVAQRLGNTKAVCRRCYVHPAVLEAFFDGQTIATVTRATSTARADRHALSVDERAVVRLLQRRLAPAPARPRAA
jgi:DNA topoisomerase-1